MWVGAPTLAARYLGSILFEESILTSDGKEGERRERERTEGEREIERERKRERKRERERDRERASERVLAGGKDAE